MCTTCGGKGRFTPLGWVERGVADPGALLCPKCGFKAFWWSRDLGSIGTRGVDIAEETRARGVRVGDSPHEAGAFDIAFDTADAYHGDNQSGWIVILRGNALWALVVVGMGSHGAVGNGAARSAAARSARVRQLTCTRPTPTRYPGEGTS